MRKFFTFVILAVMAVSAWGTEYQIGMGGTTGTTQNAPFSNRSATYISQLIYTTAELQGAGMVSGDLSAISFWSTATTAYTRNVAIYIAHTSHQSFSTSTEKLVNGTLITDVTKVYEGEVPITATAGWYKITFGEVFSWNGTNNILVCIVDNTNATSGTMYRTHKSYSAGSNRGIYKGQSINPTSTTISGAQISDIPVIKIFMGSDDPTPITTPTINVSATELDFGSYYPAAETVSKTFTVTASDLTDDITFSAITGVSYNPASISKDNEALAGDGVEVTVTLGSGYTFPISNPAVSVASTGATSKSVTLKATKITDSDFTTKALNFISTNGYYIVNNDVTINSINPSDKSMEIKAVAATKNANYANIDGQATFAVGGIFNGLKGKYENEVFKIFSYTKYTAPTPTSVVEVDEDIDHSTDWTDIEDGENVSTLTIKRTIVPNEWNSIVLPTHLTSTEVGNIFGDGTDVEEFTNAVITSSNITLNFTKETNGLEAGVPYLIKPTQAIANPLNLQNRSFTKTVTPVEKNGICFEGVLVPTEIDGGDGSDYIIVGANNTLFHPTGTGTIKGMRAYFHVVGETAKAAIKKSPMISLSTGSTTAMTLVKSDADKAYKAIENGRIVIKANGKKVNILGQTVK